MSASVHLTPFERRTRRSRLVEPGADGRTGTLDLWVKNRRQFYGLASASPVSSRTAPLFR